jgi:hypothetical protein
LFPLGEGEGEGEGEGMGAGEGEGDEGSDDGSAGTVRRILCVRNLLSLGCRLACSVRLLAGEGSLIQ